MIYRLFKITVFVRLINCTPATLLLNAGDILASPISDKVEVHLAEAIEKCSSCPNAIDGI